jgi:hypothetical protein
MTADHDYDGLYDLRDLQDSDAWFTDAAARSLGTADPLSPSVIAMLERLDRELASLAPVDRGTVTALISGLTTPIEKRASRGSGHTAARHVRRNLVVVGVTGALLVGVGGVAAASPGSFFYPVREATLGASERTTPVDLSDVESELNRIEVRIAEAQQAGGITESSRTALARRMGVIHPIVERASGEEADALRARWTRDDLVLIALPHLDAPPAAPAADPTTAATPDDTVSAEPAPSATPDAPRDTPSAPTPPRPSSRPEPGSSQSPRPSGNDHETAPPSPKPSPSRSHDDGDHSESPQPDRTKTPKPSPTSTGGSTSDSGTGTGSGSGQSKND